METSNNTITEIKELWKSLCQEIKKNKRIKLEMFETAFAETYSLLSEYAAERCLDKQYIQLVSEAYLFSNINDSTLDSSCLAASVLTERMLRSFAFSCTSGAAETTTVYILEAHEEIELNFKDVNGSIAKLAKVFDNTYLK